MKAKLKAIDAAIRGMEHTLDPVGYIESPPDFAVRKTMNRGGLKIEAGKIDGWNILRFTRRAWSATAIIAWSDEYFPLKTWPTEAAEDVLNGINGIMREVA